MALRLRQNLCLHPKQMEVFRNDRRFRVVVAGRRWGKTQLAKTIIIKKARKPHQHIWYVAPTYKMAKGIMWQDLVDAIPKKWIRKVNETSLTIYLINRTIIELKGADKPDSLRGAGLHFLVMDEFQDMTEETWVRVLRPALADKKGDALFIGTPKQYNHLYALYKLGQRGDTYLDKRGRLRANAWASWQFPTITSPFISRQEIEDAMRDMDEKSFDQEFNASFTNMAGRVYYPFDRASHVRPCAFNPALPIWVGIDFNIDPMSGVIFQYQKRTGELWAVNEIVRMGSNTSDLCDEIEKAYWRVLENAVLYPDPASAYRQHARGESDLDIFRERGMSTIKYRRRHPPVADRVNSVNRMLRAANGAIRLYIDPSCKEFIKGLEQTLYKPGSREVDKSQGVEHPCDAGGYCIELEFPIRKVQIGGLSV